MVIPEFAPAQVFDRGGLAMAYVDEGQGAPILMVHGNPTWSYYYRNLVAAMSPTHRCVAPDHIGCGRSDKPDDRRYAYTLASRIDDLQALVEHLDLRGVTLVVHDWGGAIGLGWAGRAPERVDRIVVLNTAAFGLPPGKRFPWTLRLARLPGLGAVLVRGANAFVEGTIRFGVHRRLAPEVAAGYRAPYRTWADRIAVHRFVQDIPLRPGDRAYPTLQEVTAGLDRLRDKPMLVAWGLRDFVFDATFLEAWIHRFPAAEVHRFHDAGHLVLEDAGRRIIALVRSFVTP